MKYQTHVSEVSSTNLIIINGTIKVEESYHDGSLVSVDMKFPPLPFLTSMVKIRWADEEEKGGGGRTRPSPHLPKASGRFHSFHVDWMRWGHEKNISVGLFLSSTLPSPPLHCINSYYEIREFIETYFPLATSFEFGMPCREWCLGQI